MQSPATTVEDYLASLDDARRATVSAMRDAIRANLDGDYRECMAMGMIGYVVPHSVFPAGYHCNPKLPLQFAALASQKNYVSLYMMGLYCGSEDGADSAELRWFRDAWAASGKKKLDMGKACVRFKQLDDVPLDVIGEAIRRIPAKLFVQRYSAVSAGLDKAKAAAKARAKAAPKNAA